MRDQFIASLDQLKSSIFSMGKRAGADLARAIDAFREVDAELAQMVRDADDELDQQEVEHEQRIIQMIARHQPVAHDLRLLVSCLRVNWDVERVGDLAGKIARNTLRLPNDPMIIPVDGILNLADLASAMWSDALHAFLKEDADLAADLVTRDDAVDRVNGDIVRALLAMQSDREEHVRAVANIIGVCRQLERVGDCAADIAMEVIYIKRGEQVRHLRPAAG